MPKLTPRELEQEWPDADGDDLALLAHVLLDDERPLHRQGYVPAPAEDHQQWWWDWQCPEETYDDFGDYC